MLKWAFVSTEEQLHDLAPPFFCSSPGRINMDPTVFFFLQDPPYSASDKHCTHWLCFLSLTLKLQSHSVALVLSGLWPAVSSVNTPLQPCFWSTYQPRHAADATAEEVIVDGDYWGNYCSQVGRTGRRCLSVELCRFVTFSHRQTSWMYQAWWTSNTKLPETMDASQSEADWGGFPSKPVKSIVTHPGWTNKTLALEGLSCF